MWALDRLTVRIPTQSLSSGFDKKRIMATFELTLSLTNTSEEPFEYVLEPWTITVVVPPKSTVKTYFATPQYMSIPITHKKGQVVVEAWEGCHPEEIYLDDERIVG